MDIMHSVIAGQYAQERIAAAQADRLAKDARQQRSSKRSRRRALRLFRRPVLTGAVAPRR